MNVGVRKLTGNYKSNFNTRIQLILWTIFSISFYIC